MPSSQTPSTTSNRRRRWIPMFFAALGGAVAMILLGQVFALAGGSCAILCHPPIAAAYGALIGLVAIGSRRAQDLSDE